MTMSSCSNTYADIHEQDGLQVSGHYAGIGERGQLIELGWSKWPILMHLAWQDKCHHSLQMTSHSAGVD